MSTDKKQEVGMLSMKQVAKILGVSTTTVGRENRRGRLPAVQIGRILRFSPAEVEAYIARNKTG